MRKVEEIEKTWHVLYIQNINFYEFAPMIG